MRAPFDPGALYVRRTALIEAQADIVWKAFESEDRMRTWFGHGHILDRYEPQLGGAVNYQSHLMTAYTDLAVPSRALNQGTGSHSATIGLIT